MSKKIVNVVTCRIVEEDGRFNVSIVQTLQSGKSVMAGYGCLWDTHEEAVERATKEIKKFLMPVRYSEEPLDLEDVFGEELEAAE